MSELLTCSLPSLLWLRSDRRWRSREKPGGKVIELIGRHCMSCDAARARHSVSGQPGIVPSSARCMHRGVPEAPAVLQHAYSYGMWRKASRVRWPRYSIRSHICNCRVCADARRRPYRSPGLSLSPCFGGLYRQHRRLMAMRQEWAISSPRRKAETKGRLGALSCYRCVAPYLRSGKASLASVRDVAAKGPVMQRGQ